MSLRWRITLLTAGLIAGSVLVVGLGIYLVAARIQLATVDRALESALTDTRVGALALRGTTADDEADVAIGLGRIAARDGVLTVLRHAGTAGEPLPFPALTTDDVADAQLGPVTVPGSPDQRVLVRAARPGGALVVAAAPLTTLETERSRLTRGIVSSAAVVAVLGAVAAWLFVRRAFRPVELVVEVAASVAAGDLTPRIAPTPTATELARLSTSVNTMIDAMSDSLAEVSSSQDRLRRFVSDASHEIRTPLTVIRGYAEILSAADAPRTEVEVRALQRILAESGRLERLVTQLLLLERLDARGDSREVFDLAAVVQDGFVDLTDLSGRPVVVDVEPTPITADPDAWRQLVANLVQNIERHTPPQSDVAVRLRSEGGRATLVVDDAGPGIPPEDRHRVLDRFATTAAGGSGFGLGMSIVAAVVEAADGTLSLADSPLGGLRVTVTVPVAGGTSRAG